MLLGRISLVQCGLGQFTLGQTPWAKRLGPSYSAPTFSPDPFLRVVIGTCDQSDEFLLVQMSAIIKGGMLEIFFFK